MTIESRMFIKRNDYEYVVKLYESLDEETQKQFLSSFLKAVGARAGEDLRQAIRGVTEQIVNEQAIESKQWVTRTMIQKVYKEVKDQQP